MKKLIGLLIIVLVIGGCQKKSAPTNFRYVPVDIGTTPDDGTGDNLRTAFAKINTGFAEIGDSLANIYTEAQVDAAITKEVADSINALRDSALVANTYIFLQADSNTYGGVITKTYFETYGGGGGGSGGYEWLQFIVGITTGAPANADTSFTVSSFAGDRIELYRGTDEDLSLQHLNKTATNGKTGYRYNSSGTIVVRPAWSTGDRAYLRAVAEGYITEATLTGGASDLDGKLLAGWELNETSGTNAADVLGTYNGTYVNSPLLNQSGKFGVCPDFDGTDDYVNMGTNAALRLQTFSVSFWVNTTSSGGYEGLTGNHVARSAVNYGWSAITTTSGKVEFTVYYSGGSNQITSTTSVNTGAWFNVICTFDGTNTNIYINGGSSEDTDATAGTIIYHADNTYRIGDRSDVDLPFDGKIDCVYYFDEVITSDDRTTLQTQTYPF